MKSKVKNNLHLIKALRASFFTKFGIYFGLLSFLLVSCNPNVETFIIESPNVSISSIVSNDGIGLYNTMELFRSVAINNNIQSPEELLSYFSGVESAEPIAKLINSLDEETTRFNEIGYNSFIQEKVSQDKLSSNMKEWLLGYENTVLNFMDTKPNENEFMSYFDDIGNFNYSQNLSLDEVSLVTKTLNDAKEYAKYYYLHYSMDDDGSREADCSFWEKLGCGLLYVAIFVVIFIALVALIELALASGGIVIAAGSTIGTSLTGAAAIEALLLVNYKDMIGDWTKSFFEWCCGKKEEKICAAPIGSHVREVGCNRFRYTIFGPGNYSTTSWLNTNTTPASVVTPTPSLVVSIPTVGSPSTFMASILCTELPSGDVSTFSWLEALTLVSNTEFPPLQWAVIPPQEVSFQDLQLGDSEIELSVLPSNEALYLYDWEVSGEAGIEGSGSDAFLDVWDIGLIGVYVTVTHKCTGESKTKSTIITITE